MAQPAYTYDPEKIAQGGKDQMRFELGDTMTDGGFETCALCDAEYDAIIAANARWKVAKLRCIESILARFSYEVDTTVGELSLSLHQRVERWQKMKSDLENELNLMCGPMVAPPSIAGPHYFHVGMMENRRCGGTEEVRKHVPTPR